MAVPIDLSAAAECLEARDRARRFLGFYEGVLDLHRKQYSAENGYKVPLRRESFEAMLRAVPPEPGSDAGASSVRPVRS